MSIFSSKVGYSSICSEGLSGWDLPVRRIWGRGSGRVVLTVCKDRGRDSVHHSVFLRINWVRRRHRDTEIPRMAVNSFLFELLDNRESCIAGKS